MKRLVIGILAHVDSGKTTLCEALLYKCGNISSLGRVDHKNAFLDTNSIEKDRGITIFSKQAILNTSDAKISLLDTPGHVDFSAETERVLSVLDYAILVISGTEGVQSHTQTLWKLLEYYNIPTFVFINKMDLQTANKEMVLNDLNQKLCDGFIDFENRDDLFFESIALKDSTLLDEYLEVETISDINIKNAIITRKVFPCYFGSALKVINVDNFLDGLNTYTTQKNYPEIFGARVFKIADDEKGNRLTYLKITGGSIKVKDTVKDNKINEIRIYSGAKYQNANEGLAGDVVTVTGLSNSFVGMGLGFEKNAQSLTLEPVFTYCVKILDNTDIKTVFSIFKKLEQEETQMNVVFNERLQKIDVQIMGDVQLEVLKRILLERFNINIDFEQGSIIYKETIKNTVEGVGHYEPLRHYAEVHLLIEPNKRGKGILIKTDLSEDSLDRNWQRLILTHIEEKTHLGVLTGSPVTDVKITLINGKAHQKHTEGGDFRQATYRAIRQGLMQAESVLLEPYYDFCLEIPTENSGKALTDLDFMGAKFSAPQTLGDTTIIEGYAPVKELRNYQKSIIQYTHGQGRISLTFRGYDECKNQQEVVSEFNYNPEGDLENTPDSVFCSHGAGFNVKWNEVFDYMHLPLLDINKNDDKITQSKKKYQKLIYDEEELLKIFEHTYGKVKRKTHNPLKTVKTNKPYKGQKQISGPEYLLIDGYNIIFGWEKLKEIAMDNLEIARVYLIDRICNYQAMKKNNVILVFDAYKVKGAVREIEKHHGITVVYTKEAETADTYIEKTSTELSKNYRVRVATSDNLEQIIVFGHGAHRISALEFLKEIEMCEDEMRKFIEENREWAKTKKMSRW